MWTLFGLGLAVLALPAGDKADAGHRRAAPRRRRAPRPTGSERMNVLVVSHLYPYPGVNQHLFVHDQCVALQPPGRAICA